MMTNNPDDIFRKALSASPESLKAIKAICTPMLGIAPAVAASFFAAMEREERETELHLQRWMAETAAETLACDDVSAADKRIVTDFLEDFKSCFYYVVAGKGGKTAALGAIEAAFAIAMIAPHDKDFAKEVRRKGTERGREKRAENAKWRSKEIADAFRKVAERDNLPLKAGVKYINIHFRNKLGKFLPEGFEVPSTHGLRNIVVQIKRGQL